VDWRAYCSTARVECCGPGVYRFVLVGFCLPAAFDVVAIYSRRASQRFHI